MRRLTVRQSLALVASFIVLGAACLLWVDRWDAAVTTVSCRITDVERSIIAPRGTTVWSVDTLECGRLMIGPVGRASVAPSPTVRVGVRYELTLHGWEALLYHRQIVAAVEERDPRQGY